MSSTTRLAVKTGSHHLCVKEAVRRTRELGPDARTALIAHPRWLGAKRYLNKRGAMRVYLTSHGEEDWKSANYVADLVDVFVDDDLHGQGARELQSWDPRVREEDEPDWQGYKWKHEDFKTVYTIRNCYPIVPIPLEHLTKANGQPVRSFAAYTIIRDPDAVRAASEAYADMGDLPRRGLANDNAAKTGPATASDGDDEANPDTFADEIPNSKGVFDGAKKEITVNRYERNATNRKHCIEFHGCTCKVCDFDFSEVYGSHGEGFIHVHHITPLSKIDGAYKIKPKEDLLPVCPNCHNMLHRPKEKGGECLKVDELRELIRSQRERLRRLKIA
jgi:hypothetical protein